MSLPDDSKATLAERLVEHLALDLAVRTATSTVRQGCAVSREALALDALQKMGQADRLGALPGDDEAAVAAAGDRRRPLSRAV